MSNSHSIGSFYAFILNRSDRVRLTVVARSNYDAVVKDVRTTNSPCMKYTLIKACRVY